MTEMEAIYMSPDALFELFLDILRREYAERLLLPESTDPVAVLMGAGQ